MSFGKKENIMYSNTVILISWKLSGRLEAYVNLGKLYAKYPTEVIGVSRHTLHRKDLYDGYENDIVRIMKLNINS